MPTELGKTKLKELKSKGVLLKPIVRVGKAGLTNELIAEINKQLKKKRLIKVKLLRSFIKDKDKRQVVQELVEKTNSVLVQRVGFTAVIYKKRDDEN